MGMEKYEAYVRRARNVLVYDPGWSRDNKTGSWRALRPVLDAERCNGCDLCWLYCPEGCIERKRIAMDYDDCNGPPASQGDGRRERRSIAIDYDYCKGCGICAEECRRGALRMEREGA